MPYRYVILGGGISGLATAWFLKKSSGSVKVIEKSSRAGGWIETVQKEGFLFEQGPRSCRTKGAGHETLALIESLGLQEQVLVPHAAASNRYLYSKDQLIRMPKHLWEIPFNLLMKGWLTALITDWKSPKRDGEDESIYSFFSRRIGKKWTETLIDPFVLGIYAGDCKNLSIKSCFPLFNAWEENKGSLLRGALSHKGENASKTPFIQAIQKSPIFSFKQGMETLPQALSLQLGNSLQLNTEAVKLEFFPAHVKIHLANGEIIEAEKVISTLPAYGLSALLPKGQLADSLASLPYATVGMVNLGFSSSVLLKKGFGYLVPTYHRDIVLGCVWDSAIFPEQNRNSAETRLTVMLGGAHHPLIETMTENEMEEHALKAVRNHLGITSTPQAIQVKKAKKAIPQFQIGHEKWKQELENEMKKLSPRLILSGNAWTGVSINDCIKQAKQLAILESSFCS